MVRTTALTPKQERKLLDFLDDKFIALTRGFKKRTHPSSSLQTLGAYLTAAQEILLLILQIPPVDPSGTLKTQLLLRLTNEILTSITGYSFDSSLMSEDLPYLLEWLDDLDQAWLSVIRAQIWDAKAGEGVDLVIQIEPDAMEVEAPSITPWIGKVTPMSQTDRARLRSVLLGGASALEEWVCGQPDDTREERNVEETLGQLGLQEGFDQLFSRTLDELGGLGGALFQPPEVAIMDCS